MGLDRHACGIRPACGVLSLAGRHTARAPVRISRLSGNLIGLHLGAQTSGWATNTLVFRSDDYLSTSVPCFHVSEGLTSLTQSVTPVDDWRYLSGRHELAHGGQILLVHSGNEDGYVLAHEHWSYKRADQTNQQSPQRNVCRCSDPNEHSFEIQ